MDHDKIIFKSSIPLIFFLVKILLFIGILASIYSVITKVQGLVLLSVLFSFLFYQLKITNIIIYKDRFTIEEMHFPKRFSKKQSFYFDEIQEIKIRSRLAQNVMVIFYKDGTHEEKIVSASQQDLAKVSESLFVYSST